MLRFWAFPHCALRVQALVHRHLRSAGVRLRSFWGRNYIILLAEQCRESGLAGLLEERHVELMLRRLRLLCVDVIDYLLLPFRVLLRNHEYLKRVVQLVPCHVHVLWVELCGNLVIMCILH